MGGMEPGYRGCLPGARAQREFVKHKKNTNTNKQTNKQKNHYHIHLANDKYFPAITAEIVSG